MTPYIIIAIIGIIIGSFLNVCIYRIPKKQSIVYPSSHCGSCNKSLRALDLVPIFSYLFLKGRCRYCQSKVSCQYPLVELANGLLYILTYYYFGISIVTIAYSLLLSILLVAAVIDYETMRIPNPIIIFGLAVGAVYLVLGALYYGDFKIVLGGIGGMLVGGGIIGGFILLSLLLFKKQGMGMGDLKLLAMIGLFVGSKYAFYTIFIAVIVGGVYALILLLQKKEGLFPFGPFISIGAVIGIFWGDALMGAYLSLIGYYII